MAFFVLNWKNLKYKSIVFFKIKVKLFKKKRERKVKFEIHTCHQTKLKG